MSIIEPIARLLQEEQDRKVGEEIRKGTKKKLAEDQVKGAGLFAWLSTPAGLLISGAGAVFGYMIYEEIQEERNG